MRHKKKVALVLLALVVLAGIGVAGFAELSSRDKDKRLSGLCVGDEYGQEYIQKYYIINGPVSEDFKNLSDKVQSLDGYDRSINCMYIVLKYQLYRAATQPANDTFARLTTVADSKQTWVDASLAAEDRESLTKRVELLAIQDAERLKAVQTFRFQFPEETANE